MSQTSASAITVLTVLSLASVCGSAPAQPSTAWKTYKGANFSFDYPADMNCCNSDKDGVWVNASGTDIPFFGVEFRPGFVNRPNIAVQCAGVDDVLREAAAGQKKNAEQYNLHVRDEWSKATSTFEGPEPGATTGRLIRISNVTGQGPYNEVRADDIWITGILRKNGLFLVEAGVHRSTPGGWKRYVEFLSRVRLNGEPLPSGSVCSY